MIEDHPQQSARELVRHLDESSSTGVSLPELRGRGPLSRFLCRLLARGVLALTRFLTREQRLFNQAVVETLDAFTREATPPAASRLERVEVDLDRLSARTRLLAEAVQEVADGAALSKLAVERTRGLDVSLQRTTREVSTLSESVCRAIELAEDLQSRLRAHEEQAVAALASLRGQLLALVSAPQRSPAAEPPGDEPTTESGHRGLVLDSVYSRLAPRLRGPRSMVQERLRRYLPLVESLPLSEATPALDIGSGRGDWLGLLRDRGVHALGIERNPVLVADCRTQQLNVECAEAFDYLASRATGSYALVTAFHVLEHLPFRDLVPLLGEILRVLVPGGLFVCETPNPNNLSVAVSHFWLDPTHWHPLPPETLRILADELGFARITITGCNGSRPPLQDADGETSDSVQELPQPLRGMLTSPLDYYLVAHKPAPPANGSASIPGS